MDNRREFLKKAALLTSAAGFVSMPSSIAKAMAIDPAPGSTFYDAEHVVFLMQENRSFDHCFGTLQGVRGFNDPRAISLKDGRSAFLQTNANGETYAPFRLNIHETKSTWMGSLPHSWGNQVDARNNGRFDRWLDVKKSGHKEYSQMPLTMGYYSREDIPFYYALADAFTVCDQNFCSSLTGTTPNRLYFWTGTIREEQHDKSRANVWNEQADYDHMVSWKTYPERLEENGINWKIYQNDLSVEGGFPGEHDSWMANFGDNPIEYFTQYNVKLSPRYLNYLEKAFPKLPGEIAALEKEIATAEDSKKNQLQEQLKRKTAELKTVTEDRKIYPKEKFDKLSAKEKAIHERAFSTNAKDPDFYELTDLKYDDNGEAREIRVPKGDVLYQFRKDVEEGKLPTVSWIVAPENYSDHPSSAWFGAWYLSECMDILTKNPEVWKKTIFVLTYDENDGYYDHQPPFVSPNPKDPSTGKASASIDTSVEFVSMEQENTLSGFEEKYRRESPIGLGYRVPMVIASPWSRGGWVNSEVFDHTSSLRFLEKFLQKKTGKKIAEENISSWRKAVCGDLTSAFRTNTGENTKALKPVAKDPFIESVHKAKFKKVPSGFEAVKSQEVKLAFQEPGTRPSCALPYELFADGKLSKEGKQFEIRMEARNKRFGKSAAGAPFTIYAPGNYKGEILHNRNYAVAPGEFVTDSFAVEDFETKKYHLKLYGPNGFYREYKAGGPVVTAMYERKRLSNDLLTGNLIIDIAEATGEVELHDLSYGSDPKIVAGNATVIMDLSKSQGWYHFGVKYRNESDFTSVYAGRVETGNHSVSDPAMAGKTV